MPALPHLEKTIELKFNDIEIGENVVLTSANGESTLEILQASQETVMFKKQSETFTLEREEKRLLRELGRASVNFVL
jgi:hypothetical protein